MKLLLKFKSIQGDSKSFDSISYVYIS
jgi:hypothetical protein